MVKVDVVLIVAAAFASVTHAGSTPKIVCGDGSDCTFKIDNAKKCEGSGNGVKGIGAENSVCCQSQGSVCCASSSVNSVQQSVSQEDCPGGMLSVKRLVSEVDAVEGELRKSEEDIVEAQRDESNRARAEKQAKEYKQKGDQLAEKAEQEQSDEAATEEKAASEEKDAIAVSEAAEKATKKEIWYEQRVIKCKRKAQKALAAGQMSKFSKYEEDCDEAASEAAKEGSIAKEEDATANVDEAGAAEEASTAAKEEKSLKVDEAESREEEKKGVKDDLEASIYFSKSKEEEKEGIQEENAAFAEEEKVKTNLQTKEQIRANLGSKLVAGSLLPLPWMATLGGVFLVAIAVVVKRRQAAGAYQSIESFPSCKNSLQFTRQDELPLNLEVISGEVQEP